MNNVNNDFLDQEYEKNRSLQCLIRANRSDYQKIPEKRKNQFEILFLHLIMRNSNSLKTKRSYNFPQKFAKSTRTSFPGLTRMLINIVTNQGEFQNKCPEILIYELIQIEKRYFKLKRQTVEWCKQRKLIKNFPNEPRNIYQQVDILKSFVKEHRIQILLLSLQLQNYFTQK